MEDPTTIPTKKQQSSFFSRVLYFFPFQLLLLRLKRNHVLLLFWLLLFLYVTNVFGKNFGIVSLFLAPEYSGDINVYSFVILGFALGGFIMAFHIYSYILFSSEFLFLATLARPFLKFCLNNMIIPLLFVLTLIANAYFFLIDEQLLNALDSAEKNHRLAVRRRLFLAFDLLQNGLEGLALDHSTALFPHFGSILVAR